MANPFYQQIGNKSPINPMFKQILEFKKMVTGNPQQIIQNMINSGKISQEQVNKYTQQANEIYQQMKGLF